MRVREVSAGNKNLHMKRSATIWEKQPAKFLLFFFSNIPNFESELTRESLTRLKGLIGFDFGLKNLRTIEEDLFIDNPLIKWIYFDNDPIQHLAYNVFDKSAIELLVFE